MKMRQNAHQIHRLVETEISYPQNQWAKLRSPTYGHSNGKRAVLDKSGKVLGWVPCGRGVGSSNVVVRICAVKRSTR